jgi:hypothetical protein
MLATFIFEVSTPMPAPRKESGILMDGGAHFHPPPKAA